MFYLRNVGAPVLSREAAKSTAMRDPVSADDCAADTIYVPWINPLPNIGLAKKPYFTSPHRRPRR
jgi:hypothetical protein